MKTIITFILILLVRKKLSKTFNKGWQIRTIATIYLLICAQLAISQYFTLGTDPSYLKWEQIKTPHFKIIYPMEYEKHAQHISNGLEHVYIPGSRTLGNPMPPRTSFIVHTNSTTSKAFTPYAPRRIEFLTTPPQDFYTQNWIDDIIIHEYRHVSQYATLNTGFTRIMSTLIGEQALPAVIGLFVPLWCIEGDATLMETTMSHSGRGRVASFEMRIRAQFLDKGIYSYSKAVNGSYKDFVSNCYELGYQLVGLSRIKYGQDIWKNTLENVGRHPYTLTPFSAALKEQTGYGKTKLYQNLTTELKEKWKSQDEQIELTKSEIIKSNADNIYTSYFKPEIFLDSLILAEKSTTDDIPRIVLIDNQGNENNIITPGEGFISRSVSSCENIICWQENVPDPRWPLKDYMIIKKFDIVKKKTTQLTCKTRYFSPDISPNAEKIIVTEVTGDNEYSLVVIDSENGNIVNKISNPENLFISHPSWNADSKQVVAVVTGKKGKSLAIIDTENGSFEILIPFDYVELDWPVFYDQYLLFTASYSGIDNIYALDRITMEIFQVTSVRFGAFHPFVSVEKGLLLFSEYTANGYCISSCNLNSDEWKILNTEEKENKWYSMAETLAEQEKFVYKADSIPSTKYYPKPYHKGWNLFNFHSWAPLSINVDNYTISPGITLLSQNLLGSSFANIGWAYNLNEQTSNYHLSYTYEGLYPVISVESIFSHRKGNLISPEGKQFLSKWTELELNMGISFPLKWNYSAWSLKINPEIGIRFRNIEPNTEKLQYFKSNYLITPIYSLVAFNKYKTSLKDIYPRWNQSLMLQFENSPFNGNSNTILGAQIFMCFPGVKKNQGISLYCGYQNKKSNFYSFTDIISYPKGYSEIFINKALSYAANYYLPLIYPDKSLGSILYIKRVKTSLFYNQAFDLENTYGPSYKSAGFDLTMDFHFLNIMIPMDAGIRVVYLFENKKLRPEFIFAINLDSLY